MTTHDRLRIPGGGPGQAAQQQSPVASAALMRLQKGAGNRAVGSLLARETKTKAPPDQEIVLKYSKKDSIVIESLSLGSPQRSQSTGRGEAPPKGQLSNGDPVDVQITSRPGAHSTELYRRSFSGEAFKAIEITLYKKGKPYARVTLKDAVVSGFQLSGSGHAQGPTESWTLQSSDVEFKNLGPGFSRPGPLPEIESHLDD